MAIKRKQVTKTPLELLECHSLIVWDFDGVIKESVNIKTRAYEALFESFGASTMNFVKRHHEANGGMSRYEKVPIYLSQAGIDASESIVTKFCDRFSKSVMEGVIESPWVPGVKEYLSTASKKQIFVLVTATPQFEIEIILDRLNITECFKLVFGAPIKKETAIQKSLQFFGVKPDNVLMIGDSETDLEASKKNSIELLLRKTAINESLSNIYNGPQCKDLLT